MGKHCSFPKRGTKSPVSFASPRINEITCLIGTKIPASSLPLFNLNTCSAYCIFLQGLYDFLRVAAKRENSELEI